MCNSNPRPSTIAAIMSPVGPSLLPAHTNKRKCGDEVESDTGDEKSSHSSPSLKLASVSPNKKPRIVGPTLPPASLDERPSQPLDSDADSSSCDDEFGPVLPADVPQKQRISADKSLTMSALESSATATATAKSQRDEWMIVPPSCGDWTARVDPTKLKNRKFKTGNSSKGPAQTIGQGSNVNWTETPDEKRARLQREIMGITDISSVKGAPQDEAKARENARRLHEYNVSVISPSFLSRIGLTRCRRD